MAWVGIVVLGLVVEVSLIITLARGSTRGEEAGGPAARALLGPRYRATPPEDGAPWPAVPAPRPPVDGPRAPPPRRTRR